MLVASALACLFQVVGIGFYARLSDRYGRRSVIIGGSVLGIITAYPVPWALVNGSTALLYAGMVLGMGVVQSAVYGPAAAFIGEVFETRYRYTASSLSYQLASTVGGVSPLIAASLAIGGSFVPVAGYIMAAYVVGAIAAAFAREGRTLNLRQGAVDASEDLPETSLGTGTEPVVEPDEQCVGRGTGPLLGKKLLRQLRVAIAEGEPFAHQLRAVDERVAGRRACGRRAMRAEEVPVRLVEGVEVVDRTQRRLAGAARDVGRPQNVSIRRLEFVGQRRRRLRQITRGDPDAVVEQGEAERAKLVPQRATGRVRPVRQRKREDRPGRLWALPPRSGITAGPLAQHIELPVFGEMAVEGEGSAAMDPGLEDRIVLVSGGGAASARASGLPTGLGGFPSGPRPADGALSPAPADRATDGVARRRCVAGRGGGRSRAEAAKDRLTAAPHPCQYQEP
ncbi:hypothetical protein GCM10027445_52130 [Amycolatopsis endophytica]